MENDIFKKALELLTEKTPEVAQELIRYKQITAIPEALLIALIWVILFLFWKNRKKYDESIPISFIVILFSALMFIGTLAWIDSVIMLFFSPNLYLLKHGINMILNAK